MKEATQTKAVLYLADGTRFEGISIGKRGTSGGEICFNTGMSGYQEIYTDPSYFGQIIVNTTSHIGNYGVHLDETESAKPAIKGLVVNEFCQTPSRATASGSLQDYLEQHHTVGIAGLDTRQLVRHLRTRGAMNAVISTEYFDVAALKARMEEVPNMANLELSSQVTTPEAYELGQENDGIKIAVLDYGIKSSILRNFRQRNCQMKVFPARTTLADMKAWGADGYFLSNGPGDPAVMDYAVETTRQLVDAKLPVFGICLGHQLLARAAGVGTFKMHQGHRGLNHPVKNLNTGYSEITSQNHGFAVDRVSLEKNDDVALTHLDLNDQSVEGLRLKNSPAFSVQYHPESSPGPNDSKYLFDDFLQLIQSN